MSRRPAAPLDADRAAGPPPTASASSRPELLLVLTLPAFAAYLVIAVTSLATRTESSSAELTPDQLADLGLVWVLVHLLWMTPSVLAILGLARLASRDHLDAARPVRRLVVVTLGLVALYLASQLLAFGAGTATWGESAWYAVGVTLSLAVGWLGTIPATLLVTRELARRGVVTRTARTITVLCVLYVVWEALTYLVVVAGAATMAGTAGPPPFVLGILWAVLGARVWRSRRRTAASVRGDLS
jgi:hypothetical protein